MTNKKSKKFIKMKNKYSFEIKVTIVKAATILKLAGSIFGRISILKKPIQKINSSFQGKAKIFKTFLKILDKTKTILMKSINEVTLQAY